MSEPAKKTTKKTKRETTSRDDLVDELRNLSEVIDHLDIAVLFPEPDAELAGDCPFVDTACEAITLALMITRGFTFRNPIPIRLLNETSASDMYA